MSRAPGLTALRQTELSDFAPAPWIEWRGKGRYRPLKAVRAIEHRSRAEQLPGPPTDEAMISAIYGIFRLGLTISSAAQRASREC